MLCNPHVKSRTGPGIITWYFRHTGPYRILFHITGCRQHVALVQNTRIESPLEQVTTYPSSEILHASVSPVSPAKPPCQRILSVRYGDKVNMVGHATPDKYSDSVPGDFFFQHSKILTTVRFFMKHVYRPNTALRDVMRITGDYYARQTRHCGTLQENLTIVNKPGVCPQISQISKCKSPDFLRRTMVCRYPISQSSLTMNAVPIKT